MSSFLRIFVLHLLVSLPCWANLMMAQDATLVINGEPITLSRSHRSLAVHFRTATVLSTPSAKRGAPESVMEANRAIRWTALNWSDVPEEESIPALLRTAGIDPAQVDRTSWAWETQNGITLWFDQRISYRLASGVSEEALSQFLTAYPGATLDRTPAGLPYIAVTEEAHILPLCQALQPSGLVAWCQPEFRSQATSNTVRQISAPLCPATDPNYGDQFYLNNTTTTAVGTSTYPYWTPSAAGVDVNAEDAWCITKGSPSIVVAVVDEGVEDHEDLEDGSGQSRLIGGYYTDPSYIGNGEPINDGDAHGLAVAGIVAASHNGVGGSGVAPDVRLLSVWVEKGAGGSDLQRADGIMWAYKNGADIILNAWTYTFCSGFSSQALEDAIDSAQVYGRNGLGSLVVFSSGFIFSDGDETCVRYPANLTNVLTVGAIGPGGDTYPSQGPPSNAYPPNYAPYGNEIDLVGVSGYSRSNSFISAMDRMGDLGYNASTVTYLEYPDRNYTMYFGGTSSASAQVAGIAALMLSVNPVLTDNALMSMLTGSAVDVGPAGEDSRFGAGIADAHAAVQLAQNSLPVEWGAISATPVGDQVRLNWQTLQELNNDRFVVERSTGGAFMPIGEVEGVGTTQRTQGYAFWDQTPVIGWQRYRLRQVDLDGQFAYSPQVEVQFMAGQQEVSALYPNPAQGQVSVELFGQARQLVSFEIINLQGAVVKQGTRLVEDDVYPLTISIQELAQGLYTLKFRNGLGELGAQRLIVQP